MREFGNSYWENKIKSYLHDPFDKAFCIPGHEQRAQKILDVCLGGNVTLDKKTFNTADGIASGLERGQLPSYSKDDTRSGAVDFLSKPELTHPTSKEGKLKLNLPDYFKKGFQGEDRNKKLAEWITDQVVEKLKVSPYTGNDTDFKMPQGEHAAKGRFFFLHLALRFLLAKDNVAELGALWHKLPADTRFPNHSIWNHNAMVSAINSCMELGENSSDNIGLMVFSITPVQKFIATARKLRDYWTGSVLLSYLSFEGIRYIMENLGPDHIIYPSLIDQPLVLKYLEEKWNIKNVNPLNKANDIASFPNKFLFLVPINMAEEFGKGIKEHIEKVWQDLSNAVLQKIEEQLGVNDASHLQKMFQRQTKNYWDFHWAATKLIGAKDNELKEYLLKKDVYERYDDLYTIFNEIIQELGFSEYYETAGKGLFYSLSHSIAQSLLAAMKTKRSCKRKPEPGEKCHLCGEFEVLHTEPFKNVEDKANDYKKKTDDFWRKFWGYIKKNGVKIDNPDYRWIKEGKTDFNEYEKLCAICTIKRICYSVLEDNSKEHPTLQFLAPVFKGAKGYPMTTEVALTNFFEENNITNKKEIAQRLFDNEADTLPENLGKITNKDKYYAILIMDGDKMGRLINGETIKATWESIMHSEILKKLKGNEFFPAIRKRWQKIFNDKELKKIIITPSVHLTISEALGDFAIYGVYSIIKKYKGKLIYAGGDDVAAVLSVDNALKAAKEIQDYYTSNYKLVKETDKGVEVFDIENEFLPEQGKICYHLGEGEKISISAGILLCHHKESLSQMIQKAHHLLDSKAKKETGRNAFAISLRKRSGGERIFSAKWDQKGLKTQNKVLDVFYRIVNLMSSQTNPEKISTSLVYRLYQLKDGIDAILQSDEGRDKKLEMIISLYEKQLDRSGSFKGKDNTKQEIAELMCDLTIFEKRDEQETAESETEEREKELYFYPHPLIIASFLAKGKSEEKEENK